MEAELLCIKCPCTQAQRHATELTANPKWWTLCMALNHCAPAQLPHSLARYTVREGRLH